MKYDLIIRPEAKTDLLDAFQWYQEQRPGLGFDFKLCVDEVISKIQRNPLIHKVIGDGITCTTRSDEMEKTNITTIACGRTRQSRAADAKRYAELLEITFATSFFDAPSANSDFTNRSIETEGSPVSILATRDWLESILVANAT